MLEADPWSPSVVPGGTYRGSIEFQRSSGDPVELPLQVHLARRTGRPTSRALLALAAGVICGGLAKWANDELAPVAVLRRRYNELMVHFAPVADDLPRDAGKLATPTTGR